MSEPVRFIIISTPPQEVAQRIDEARTVISAVGASRAALAYPPHVTLRTGALVPAALVPRFIDAFAAVVGKWSPFPVCTEGLWKTSYMDRDREKYLVGYRVRKDAQLSELNQRLLRCTTWRASDRLNFEPHLTLAFDDLDLDGYVRISHWLDENPRALPESFDWTCDNVGLYRREEEAWTPYQVWRM